MIVAHFGGLTRPPDAPGYGLRSASAAYAEPELNYNACLAVLAAPVPQADAYFRALREELQEALDEGVILVERQDVWIP